MTATVTSNSTAAQPTMRPIANGTYRDCVNYLNPPVFLDVSRHNSSTRCSDIARIYGVTVANLIEWNLTLEESDEASCQVSTNYRYCVQRFRLEEEHATEYCLRKELATAAYTCKQFASTRGIDFGQFVAWNPSVGVDCEDYEPGTEYCVAVWGYRQPGIISTCNKFVMPNTTAWINNPCEIIETNFGLSHARFVAWNPQVYQNCTGLYQDYEYCVSIPNYRPTYSTIATMARATQAADVMMAVATAAQDIDDNDTMVDTGSESAEISSTNTMELDSASFSSSSLSSSGTVIAIATASATTTAITTAVLSSGNSDAVTTSTNTPSAASQSVVIPFVRIREE